MPIWRLEINMHREAVGDMLMGRKKGETGEKGKNKEGGRRKELEPPRSCVTAFPKAERTHGTWLSSHHSLGFRLPEGHQPHRHNQGGGVGRGEVGKVLSTTSTGEEPYA